MECSSSISSLFCKIVFFFYYSHRRDNRIIACLT